VYAGTDYRNWWIDSLGRQAAAPGSPAGTGHSRFFKGTELFSNVYDSDTTTGVMGAHLWALTHPSDPQATTIKNLAKDYLRRTFFAWGLTASLPDFQRAYDVHGTTYSLVQSANYNCPVLAMASPRSRTAFTQDSKRWLLARATGLSSSCYKLPQVRDAVDYMVSQNGSVFGLSAFEATQIRNLVNATSVPGSIGSILGAVRLRTDFHFLLWNDGRRATYWIGGQLNNNTTASKGTVFTAFYDRITRNLDLLFIGGSGHSSCLDEPNERVHIGACGSTHYLELPNDPPTHHFVLGPNGWRSCSNLSCS
jgi:hypothetical protein